MADTDILVSTHYTVEGYQQAINKAERIGYTMRRIGGDLTQLGYILDNQFIKSIGHSIQGLQDMASVAEGLVKTIKEIPVLGKILAGVGGAFIGSKIFDATIGKAQGTSTDQILSQIKTLVENGFDTGAIIKDMRLQAQIAQITANNAVFEFKQSLSKNDPAVNAVIGQILSGFSGFLGNKGIAPRAQAAQDVAQQQRDQQTLTQFYGNINDKLKAAASYQDRIATASKTYHAAEFDRKMQIAQLEAEVTARRIQAAQSLAADLSKMDSSYYANRLQMAQSFGLETQRAEEDHQRNMRRLTQDHDRRMSKLADSRDALGLEDEMEAFEDERRNAEEDYRVMQSRRNQDYANQLRDMERAFQQQRQERINAYNQQLRDIAAYNIAQRQLIAQQMKDIAKAVMDAFTQAARTFTNTMNTSNSTNTNTLNQTNNFPTGVDAQGIMNLVNQQVTSIFGAATK